MNEEFMKIEDIRNELLSLSKKYEAEIIKNEIDTIAKDFDCKIGFLGDFNSGKSTLINAMLKEKLLPVMVNPTTKSIIEVHPKNNIESKVYYRVNQDDKSYVAISPIEFSDVALGKKEGRVALFAKSNEFLKESFILMDTPGFNSIYKIDEDVAFELLPELDGIILCLDANKGALPKNVINFLKNNYVKNLFHRLTVAVTFASTKNERLEKIRSNVIEQLKDIKNEIKYKGEIPPVVLVDGKMALENASKETIEELINVMNERYYIDKKRIYQERLYKILQQIGGDLLQYLNDKNNFLSYNTEDLEKDKINFENKLNELKKEKENLYQEFNKITDKIIYKVEEIVYPYETQLIDVQTDQIFEIFNDIEKQVYKEIHPILSKYLNELDLPNVRNAASSIVEIHKTVDKYTDIVKKIANLALIAILPEEGFSLIGDVTAGTVADTLLASSSSMIAQSTSQSSISNIFSGIAKFLKSINPIEIIGEIISEEVKRQKIKNALSGIAQQISSNIINSIKDYFDEGIFYPLEKEIKEMIENIKNAQTNILDRIDEVDNLKKDIKSDSEAISKLIA